MTEVVFVVTAALAVCVLQTTSMLFLAPPEYKPDLMLILVIWSSLRLPFLSGVCFAFCAGWLMDGLSGGPVGLFALVYSVLFVACAALDANFRIDSHSGRFLMVIGAALCTGAAVLIARWLRGPVGLGWHVAFWIVLKSAVTALASLAVCPALEWGWNWYCPLVGGSRNGSRPTDYV